MPGLMVQVLMMLLVTVLMVMVMVMVMLMVVLVLVLVIVLIVMVITVMVMMMVAGVHSAILGARVKADILVGSFPPMLPTSSRLWRWVVPHFTGPGW